jgi:D-alanyl-lipoteichoic acid acyltransferase DltB (MBOAT superfamily)
VLGFLPLIAYLADVYANKAQEYALANYALFVTWFPHLIAGPIMHHREMMPQFATAFRGSTLSVHDEQ